MDDVLGMRRIQRIGNLNTQPQDRVDLEWPGFDPLLQVWPTRNSMAMEARPLSSSIS
jgi:hypothetical protein